MRAASSRGRNNSWVRRDTGGIRRLMFKIDMGKGWVGQDVLDRWESELVETCREFVARADKAKAAEEVRATGMGMW